MKLIEYNIVNFKNINHEGYDLLTPDGENIRFSENIDINDYLKFLKNENYNYKNRCREVVQMLDKILNHEPFGYEYITQMKRILEEGKFYE